MLAMPLPRAALVLAALALAAACTPAGPRDDGPSSASAGTGPLATSLSVQPAGDSVRLALQVTNASAEPLALQFRSGQTHDFVVRRGAEELWRWSADMGFTQALQTVTLAPGETRTFAETWRPPPGTAGTLTAVGRLTSSSHPAERSTEFTLP